jgi:hypothetical protein
MNEYGAKIVDLERRAEKKKIKSSELKYRSLEFIGEGTKKKDRDVSIEST